jgi:hypothetical protein
MYQIFRNTIQKPLPTEKPLLRKIEGRGYKVEAFSLTEHKPMVFLPSCIGISCMYVLKVSTKPLPSTWPIFELFGVIGRYLGR